MYFGKAVFVSPKQTLKIRVSLGLGSTTPQSIASGERRAFNHRGHRVHGGIDMLPPRTHASLSPAIAAGIVIGMPAMGVIPAAFTVHSASTPGTLR